MFLEITGRHKQYLIFGIFLTGTCWHCNPKLFGIYFSVPTNTVRVLCIVDMKIFDSKVWCYCHGQVHIDDNSSFLLIFTSTAYLFVVFFFSKLSAKWKSVNKLLDRNEVSRNHLQVLDFVSLQSPSFATYYTNTYPCL